MNLFEKLKKSCNIPPISSKMGRFVVDDINGISVLIAYSFIKNNDQYLVVASNIYKAQQIYNSLVSLVGKDSVLLFPNDELIRAELLAQSKELVAERIYVLNQILKQKAKIIVCNLAGACRYLPSPRLFKESSLKIKVGETYNLSTLKTELVKNGYQFVNKIDQTLQFASRGDILDIYSVNYDYPIRIEFFDDEVESIRLFDPATQLSTSRLVEVEIIPASDMLLTNEERQNAPNKIHSILEKDKQGMDWGNFEQLRNNIDNDIYDLLNYSTNTYLYKYYGFIKDNHYSIFDYCSSFTKVFVDEQSLVQSNDLLQEDSMRYLYELHQSHKIISHLEMYQDLMHVAKIDPRTSVVTSALSKSMNDTVFDLKNVPYTANKRSDTLNIVQNYINDGYTILLAVSQQEYKNYLCDYFVNNNYQYETLSGYNLPEKCQIAFIDLNLNSGFILPSLKVVYLTPKELFNEKVRITRFDNRFKEATILKSHDDLQPGDYIVHEYQGIGQFLELQTLEVDGEFKDYLKLAFHGGELLYVPIGQFQLVRKYLGKEGVAPRLSRLHSKDWENTKHRIKEKVNELAERLMNLYIERSKIKGFAFKEDDEFQKEFENGFPYPLTKDQQKAIDDIKKDMESDTPMDRLLCGDVGFGKTEVAFQAAFKAINSGKQVAILCPTTLLARQHYELALERFAPFDIKIAVFSRLIPEKKQKEYIKGVNDGSIHLVIGTHRLLSKDISFKDLGLLIVDEEQRFGVEQKERIKELKNNLDVLTLSATPIPRTLQISLLGVRSLSKIDTPPSDRMPIQTYVSPFRWDAVKELIERELGRQGQVFYLHNNISTLYQCAAKLQQLLPNVRIACAHGKLTRNEVEDIMMNFYNGNIDVLVCTSIIENGIDVPNANMIIVEDSTQYGLSQLYQIKGRVGRSNRIAYAYLFYNEHRILKEKTEKRLRAIQEFTELGSGYKVAQRDLLIRGAGDILGPEQAGYIDSIGLDMYIKLLNEAVQEKMNGGVEEEETKESLLVNVYVPNEYISEGNKIELYQEVLTAPNHEALANIKLRTRDVYGKLPKEAETLFTKRSIELLLRESGIELINETNRNYNLILGKQFLQIKGVGNILFETMIPYLQIIKISVVNNCLKIAVTKRKEWLQDLENILHSILNVLKTNKVEVVE